MSILERGIFILEFKEVAVKDRALFETYLNKPEHFGSECAFTNLYIWRDYYRTWWTEIFGFLLIKVELEGKAITYSLLEEKTKTCRFWQRKSERRRAVRLNSAASMNVRWNG